MIVLVHLKFIKNSIYLFYEDIYSIIFLKNDERTLRNNIWIKQISSCAIYLKIDDEMYKGKESAVISKNSKKY